MAATNKAEAYVVIPGAYNRPIAIPARLASTILPELLHLEERYVDGAYQYSVLSDEVGFKLFDADKMTAIKVASRIDQK